MPLVCALVYASAAGPCAAAGGSGLKLSPTLTVPAAPASNTQANPPIFIDADQLGGTYNQSIEARGDVRLHKGGQSLYSDQLH
jgi:lipopolysaccharide assembly outer membrane protein LptD (OstA)